MRRREVRTNSKLKQISTQDTSLTVVPPTYAPTLTNGIDCVVQQTHCLSLPPPPHS